MSLGTILSYSAKTGPRENVKIILKLEAETTPLTYDSVKALLCSQDDAVQAHGFLMTNVI